LDYSVHLYKRKSMLKVGQIYIVNKQGNGEKFSVVYFYYSKITPRDGKGRHSYSFWAEFNSEVYV